MTGFTSKRQMAQDKEALKLALNALETADETEFWNKQKEAITAIKAALAQPAHPPLPAQRPWVGLTQQEENEIWKSSRGVQETITKTQAKLKEKNT
jgi:hypothetical protein